jgi:hypothetical protein
MDKQRGQGIYAGSVYLELFRPFICGHNSVFRRADFRCRGILHLLETCTNWSLSNPAHELHGLYSTSITYLDLNKYNVKSTLYLFLQPSMSESSHLTTMLRENSSSRSIPNEGRNPQSSYLRSDPSTCYSNMRATNGCDEWHSSLHCPCPK